MRSRWRIFLCLLLLLALAGGGLFVYGRSLWHPFYIRLVGGETVAGVVAELEEKGVARVWQNLGSIERITLLGLKQEHRLEVWGHRKDSGPVLLKTYPFTGFSGGPGPKLREGDGQIPEGIYAIEYLNPNSSYHLSMKLDYPNAFDQAKGQADGRTRLGFDIFIHGKSATVGCVPIGDAAIEELFFLVATVGKEKASVILAPSDPRMTAPRFPDVPGIDWEAELYADIAQAAADLRSEPAPLP